MDFLNKDKRRTRHSLDLGIAELIGAESALILQFLHYCIKENVGQDRTDYWVMYSYKTISKKFSYIKERKVGEHIRKMEELGWIRSEKSGGYDRTKKYMVNLYAYYLVLNGKELIPMSDSWKVTMDGLTNRRLEVENLKNAKNVLAKNAQETEESFEVKSVKSETNLNVNQKIRDEIERQLLKMQSRSELLKLLGENIGIEEGIRAFSQYWVDNENERTIEVMPEKGSKSILKRNWAFMKSYKGVFSSFRQWAEISKERPERVLTSSHEYWDNEIAEIWEYMNKLWWKRGFVLTEKRKKEVEVNAWMLRKMKTKWFTKVDFLQFIWGVKHFRKPTQENMADYIGEEHLVKKVVEEVIQERKNREKAKQQELRH